ncbi:MAG: aminoacyl-histidine dipeptidase [Ignavibacteria bacterium]|nr:aminoacyl-histidine dipeptidase [Ignavibacteria bacterium]
MGSVLGHLNPALVWKHFEALTQCPRPSKKEEKAVAYVKNFGESKGLETILDSFGNVIIKKPATKGKENVKTVILQGHLDIVCEMNRGIEFDFDNDPLQIYIDGEYVKAKGTTLGADNGIGVAAALAILEDDSFEHGPIECLFTLDEETGLTGATNLQAGVLKGSILLNLDSEEEGSLYIGCSGGKDTKGFISFTTEETCECCEAFELKVAGLLGGHSGLEIHEGRGNAIKIINRLMWEYSRKNKLRLSSIEGGNKHNAIPREAFATVLVPEVDVQKFTDFVKEYEKTVKAENATKEPNLTVTLGTCEYPAFKIDAVAQEKLMNILYAMPHGVIKMSADIPGLVETSTNLAVVHTLQDKISIMTSQRSSVASENDDVVNMAETVLLLAGAEVEHGDGYPGWKPDVHSEILGVFKSTYHDLFNKEPEVKAIHAGLECGIIGERYPGLDMISFGPTMYGVHSPDERLFIPTVEPFYNLLKEVLKRVPTV